MATTVKPGNLTARAKALEERTNDAYSFDRYRSWFACCKLLLARGYTEREAEAILRSKWMHWAADVSDNAYGAHTAADLAAYLDGQRNLAAEVQALVDGTFPPPRFTLTASDASHFEGVRRDDPTKPMNFSARYDLFLIGQAWEKHCDFEDLADGFGKGLGTMDGDWSGIRDSSDAAITAMLERALNHLFPGFRL